MGIHQKEKGEENDACQQWRYKDINRWMCFVVIMALQAILLWQKFQLQNFDSRVSRLHKLQDTEVRVVYGFLTRLEARAFRNDGRLDRYLI